MHRLSLMIGLLVTCCNKAPPQQEAGAVTSAAIAPTTSSAAQPTEAPKAWYVGSWKAEFTVARHSSATSGKEGGPAAWEKDAGQIYSGAASAELRIDPQGEASGSIKGALGDLALSGKVDDATLRAKLLTRSDDPKSIQNGYVILAHDGDTLKGHLDAASGDALVLRQGELTFRRIEP